MAINLFGQIKKIEKKSLAKSRPKLKKRRKTKLKLRKSIKLRQLHPKTSYQKPANLNFQITQSAILIFLGARGLKA